MSANKLFSLKMTKWHAYVAHMLNTWTWWGVMGSP